MNCFLLIVRCGMDDAPIRCRDTRQEVVDDLKGLTEAQLLRECRRVMYVDSSEVMALGIVEVRDGIAQEIDIVDENGVSQEKTGARV